jgi:hypothetical protein
MRIRLMAVDLTGIYGGIAHHSQNHASIEPNPRMTRARSENTTTNKAEL